ncbi:MAG: GNAT family N-acetyltransferase [Pseudolabrys sp.]
MSVSFDFVPMRPTESDLDRFRACFQRNGWEKSLPVLRWMYLEKTGGHLLVTLAVDKSSLDPDYVAGIYAVVPVRMKIAGAVVSGSQSNDTLTDEGFRNRGLFVSLAKDVYTRCKDAAVELVYGFPTGNSAPGFFNKLGWVRLDPVPFLIKPLRLRYFIKRLPILGALAEFIPDIPLRRKKASGLRLRPLTGFDSATDAVWAKFSKTIGVSVERDAAYMNWRFARPGENYKMLGSYGAAGELNGFVIYTGMEKHGGRIGYIMEALFDPAVPETGAELISAAVNELAREKCDAVLSWCFEHSPNYASYRQAGFLHFPERLRPIELHFGARSLAETHADIVSRRENWYVSYVDSDTV